MGTRGPQLCLSKFLDHSVNYIPGFKPSSRTQISPGSDLLASSGQNTYRCIHSNKKTIGNSGEAIVHDTKDTKPSENALERLKNSVSGILSSASSISIPQPLKNVSLPSLNLGQKPEVKRKSVMSKVENNVNREQHTFLQHLEEINESIESFYDTTIVDKKVKIADSVRVLANKNGNSKHLKDGEGEESSYLKMLKIPSRIVGTKSSVTEAPKKPKKSELDSRTTDLVINIKKASTLESKHKRLQELCSHLLQYPDCRSIAMKNKVLPHLLKLRQSQDHAVQSQAHQALALVGYVPPPRGRGIRILSVDGGGTKGLVAIEMLRVLERCVQTPLHQMFDYVIGTSTGALVTILAFLYQLPLDECEILYKEKSTEMFTTNKLTGSAKLLWSYAYHDSAKFEQILRKLMGEKYLIDFTKDPSVPKMSAVSTLVNVPKWKNFMFRNYNLPPGVYSDYPGNCKQKVWEAVRASSAAPTFYNEITLGELMLRLALEEADLSGYNTLFSIQHDGGLLANNPTAIGIHECKLLWPNESIQCIVSIGTGRYEPHPEFVANKWVLKDIVLSVTEKATDTESVHMTLKDLLPPSTYYRFNPYVFEDRQLDEIRPDKIHQMQQDAKMYAEKNEGKLMKAVEQMKLSRLPHQKAQDYIKHQLDSRVN